MFRIKKKTLIVFSVLLIMGLFFISSCSRTEVARKIGNENQQTFDAGERDARDLTYEIPECCEHMMTDEDVECCAAWADDNVVPKKTDTL